jgi:hypothetical protein
MYELAGIERRKREIRALRRVAMIVQRKNGRDSAYLTSCSRTPGDPARVSKGERSRQSDEAEASRVGSYGTSMIGARQNAPFCPVGFSTVTWQSYWPGGS